MTWPALRFDDWSDTLQTVHLWTQVAGKVRMLKAPLINHWWQVVLYVNSRGLGTSAIPDGERSFEIDFDFIDHRFRISTSDGEEQSFKLEPMPVATFYRKTMSALADLGINARIMTLPQEVPDPISFEKDLGHRTYDADAINRFWRALVQADRVLNLFRSEYLGKVSPVHFFWGGFDLAVTRFSGREAPQHPGVPGLSNRVTREAYSHEVSSAGFWPGGNGMEAAFYSYAYPEPPGFASAPVQPAEAFYSEEMREYFLPWEAVRTADDSEGALMMFLRTTYEAAADLAGWDRTRLERER